MSSVVLSLACGLLLLAQLANAQDFSVPSTWTVCRVLLGRLCRIDVPQNASSHLSRSDRITLAQNALGRVKENYQAATGDFSGMHIIQRQTGHPALI